jgi:hypothetical protein
MKLKIEWVPDDEVATKRLGRKPKYDVSAFMEELYANPMRWAKFPVGVSQHTWGYRLMDNYENIEVIQSGGNNLANSHPDKKDWTVYVRFNPEFKRTPGKKRKKVSELAKTSK